MNSVLANDKDVTMKNRTNQVTAVMVTCTILISSVGCAALPWKKKKQETMTAAQYAEQAAANVQYNNDVDFSQDYQSSPAPANSYTAPKSASAPSGGGGSCCH